MFKKLKITDYFAVLEIFYKNILLPIKKFKIICLSLKEFQNFKNKKPTT